MIVEPIVRQVVQPVAMKANGDQTATAKTMFLADMLFDYRYSTPFEDAAGATVATGTDPIGFLQDLTGNAHAYQESASRRPLLSSGAWDFDGTDDFLQCLAKTDMAKASSFTVPDLSDSIAGKGFTCTGITLDTSDSTLWIANDGRSNASDVTYRAGLVNVTTAGALVVERDLSAAYPSMTTIQGVVYDAVDDSLWFCSTAENLIRHVSAVDGSNIGSFASTAPNGIALDTVSANLIVVNTSGTLTTYNKSGVQQATFSFEVCDCIHYDSTNGILYYAMEPAGGINFVGLFHLATRQYMHRWVLPDADALEGLVIEGTTVYVTNDNYFHGQTGTNEVLVYTIAAVPTLVTQDKITLACKFTLDSAPTGTRAILSISSGGVTNAGVGIHAIGSSSTGIRVFANTDVGTTERSFVDFTTLPDLTTTRYVLCEIDLTAEEARLWVDGTQYGGTQSIPNVAGAISTGMLVIGGAKFGSDELPGVVKVAALFNRNLTTAEKATVHSYLAAA